MAIDTSQPIYVMLCTEPLEACGASMQAPAQSFQDLYAAMQTTNPQQNIGNPFVMSVADGLTVSGLILFCWASAWVVRMMVRSVSDIDAD